jgi:hypothetical protein
MTDAYIPTPEDISALPLDQVLPYLMYLQPEYSATRGWQPVDVGTQSTQGNVLQDRMQLLSDPIFGALFGFDQLGSAQAAPTKPIPQPVISTPTLDRFRSSGNEWAQMVAESIQNGKPEFQIRDELRQLINAGQISQEVFDDLVPSISTIEKEVAQANVAQAEYDNAVAAQTAQPSKFDQQFAEAGLPSPREQYTKEQMTGDQTGVVGADVNRLLGQLKLADGAAARTAASSERGLDRQADALRRDHTSAEIARVGEALRAMGSRQPEPAPRAVTPPTPAPVPNTAPQYLYDSNGAVVQQLPAGSAANPDPTAQYYQGVGGAVQKVPKPMSNSSPAADIIDLYIRGRRDQRQSPEARNASKLRRQVQDRQSYGNIRDDQFRQMELSQVQRSGRTPFSDVLVQRMLGLNKLGM